jgi:HNH endonuclease
VVDILTLSDGAVDRYADITAEVAKALRAGNLSDAADQLEPILDDQWLGRLTRHGPSGPGAKEGSARAVSDRTRVKVLTRDGFRCTYCGGRTVPRCVLVAVSDVFPRFLYNANFARGRIHPAFWALAPEVDHVHPFARGGSGELDNLTTLHTFCNAQKSDTLVDDLPVIEPVAADSAWNGLILEYPYVVQAGNAFGLRNTAVAYHQRWLRNFDLQPLGPITDPPAPD